MATLTTVQLYTASDPVFWEVDNRPLEDIITNITAVNDEVVLATQKLDSAKGNKTDVNERISVELNADGELSRILDYDNGTPTGVKEALLPNITQLQQDVVVAGSMNYSHFEARAEAVRKITPSGFNKTTKLGTAYVLSSFYGLETNALGGDPNDINAIRLSLNSDSAEVVINGYRLIISNGDESTNLVYARLSAPPATGTRQDLVFIESWKEEIDKVDGLFFPYGNTQYSSSASVDGVTLTNNPTAQVGSDYFTPAGDIYCVKASDVTSEFIQNPENNIGVLENGNFFQVRYRIRVEEKIDPTGLNQPDMIRESLSVYIRPQGQLSEAPLRGSSTSGEGIFFDPRPAELIEDSGLLVGCHSTAYTTTLSPISGLSLDGFTYAIPVCAVHRRNTGVYGFDNLNGTAFENSWICTIPTGNPITAHGISGQTAVTVGSSTFKVVDMRYTSGVESYVRMIRLTGTGTPAGTANWDYNGSSYSVTSTIVKSDDGSFLKGATAGDTNSTARPDSLFSDIIDRRDVLDLRHKVSLDGDFDEDVLYQETKDLVVKGEYRQEWEQLKAFDNDGNGSGTIETGIYGNILMESLGLGATVPDAGVNTNITRKENCNNGIPVGFNGAHSKFSDAETNEDFTVYIEDHADGIASRTHGSEDGLVSYNSVSHAIEIDLTQHSSYVADISKDPTLLSGHLPEVKWGNGAKVAGVWTRNNDYNWSFEIKEFGAVLMRNSVTNYIGDIYEDPAGNQWEVVAVANGAMNGLLTPTGGTWPVMMPVYSDHDGSVLPSTTQSMTKISGLGSDTYTLDTTEPAYISVGANSEGLYTQVGLGYSNAAHGTGANEAIFAKYRINYKAGSSCLPELPYNTSMGASLFIDGTEVAIGRNSRPMLSVDPSTKTVDLTGLVDASSPVFRLGGNTARSPYVLIEGSNHYMWYTIGVNEIGYATSTDSGLTWTDEGSVLSISSPGSQAFMSNGCTNPCVVKDGATYHMLFQGFNGTDWKVGRATSTDRINWTVIAGGASEGSVVDAGAGNNLQPKFIKDGVTWKIWINNVNINIQYFTSTDLVTFSAPTTCTGMHPSGYNYAYVESPQVIKDGSLYKMFMPITDSTKSPYPRPYYFISSDGINWINKGQIFDVVSGDEIQTHTHYPMVVKNGPVYEMYYGSYMAGEIHRGVLAMSDPNNVGSSLTGVYTNATPQVNLGFKSNDTLILHYDRLAMQHTSTPLIDSDVTIKEGFATTAGTGVSNNVSLLNYNNWYDINHPSYEVPNGSVASVYSNTRIQQYIDALEYGVGVEFKWFKPSELGFTDEVLRGIDYVSDPTPSNFHNPARPAFSAYASINAKYPKYALAYQSTGNERGGTIGIMGVIKNDRGLYFQISFDHGSQALRLFAYTVGVLAHPIALVGRPLVK